MSNVTIPYDDFMRLITYEGVNQQGRWMTALKTAARCRELYGYPPRVGDMNGFNPAPLPNEAVLWLAHVVIGGAASPLIDGNTLKDVGLTGPLTLTAPLLAELARRLSAYEQRERRGKLRASRSTGHQEVL